MRPDAVSVWKDTEVRERLSWYRQVMIGRLPAKFMLCRKIPTQVENSDASQEELWNEHASLSQQLCDLVKNVESGSESGWSL